MSSQRLAKRGGGICFSTGSTDARNGMAFRFKEALNSAHAEAEDKRLIKELNFGGPCFEGTLQKPTLVSESSPVAGAIEESQFLLILRCRGAPRDSKIQPAATHLLSVNCLYQMNEKKRKGVFEILVQRLTAMLSVSPATERRGFPLQYSGIHIAYRFRGIKQPIQPSDYVVIILLFAELRVNKRRKGSFVQPLVEEVNRSLTICDATCFEEI